MITVAPMENPLKKKTDMLVIMVVELTAARACPHEIPHHNGIHRIVQHLENIANHQWQGKFQDQPGNVAGSHVFGCGTGHGTACLSLFGMDNFYYNIEKGGAAHSVPHPPSTVS